MTNKADDAKDYVTRIMYLVDERKELRAKIIDFENEVSSLKSVLITIRDRSNSVDSHIADIALKR